MSQKSIVKIIKGICPDFKPTSMTARRIDGYIYKTTDPDEIMRLIARDLRNEKIYNSVEINKIKKELTDKLR